MTAYLSLQYNARGHGATPFIHFVVCLSQSSPSSSSSILEIGILDIILSLYLHDFLPSGVSHSEVGWRDRRREVMDACKQALDHFGSLKDQSLNGMVQRHSVAALWPKTDMPLDPNHFVRRRMAWRTLIQERGNKVLPIWRLGTILNVIFLSSDDADCSANMLDALDDLFEFARCVFYYTPLNRLSDVAWAQLRSA